MMDQEPIIFLGNLSLIVGWAFMTTFAVRYFFLSAWRKEKVGRALMGFMGIMAAILTYVMVAIVFGEFPGRLAIRTVLFVLFATSAGRFLSILIEAQQSGDNVHTKRQAPEEGVTMWDRIKGFFRREPTLYIGLIGAALNWIVGFQIDGLSAEQAALWMTGLNAVLGVWAAIKTRPIVPQAFTYAVTSLAGLGAAYGLDYTQEQLGQFNTLVLAFLIFMTRQQVSPAGDAGKTGVLGNKVTTE